MLLFLVLVSIQKITFVQTIFQCLFRSLMMLNYHLAVELRDLKGREMKVIQIKSEQ